jgi:hypothetical protein
MVTFLGQFLTRAGWCFSELNVGQHDKGVIAPVRAREGTCRVRTASARRCQCSGTCEAMALHVPEVACHGCSASWPRWHAMLVRLQVEDQGEGFVKCSGRARLCGVQRVHAW